MVLQCALLFPNKAIKRAALYVAGFVWLTLLFCAERLSFKAAEWKRRLQRQNVSPRSYSWQFFNQSFVVYIRVPGVAESCSRRRFSLGSHMFYIGSTKVGMFEREYARVRKHDQLFQSSYVQAEPAVKWWFCYQSFVDFVPIVLAAGSSYAQVWTLEHLFVQNWRPPLNYPFSNKLVFKGDRVTVQRVAKKHAAAAQRCGKRLFLKLRRRSKTFQNVVTEFGSQGGKILSRSSAWSILFLLSQLDGQGWQMQKLLATQTNILNLYALDRLASALEEPYRGVAKKRLRAVLLYKGLAVPRLAKPLAVPLLANKLFKQNVKKWVVQVRKMFAHKALPFHLPTKEVIEKRHGSVGEKLFTFRRWLKKFSQCPGEDLCRCQSVLQKHPELECIDGHVASPASRLSVSRHLRRLLGSSAGCCFFPRYKRYKDISVQEVGKWAEHHHLPVNEVVQQWLQLLSVEFPAHVKAVSGRFSVSDVLRAAREMEDMVVHSRDHAYNQIMIFCPRLYRSAVLSTFEDKDVYYELAGHPYSIAKSAFDAIPCQLKSRYAWSIKETYLLPKAYVFLKKKKDFKQARSIINFRGSCLSRLCKIVACVLNEVCHVAFPANFGKLKLHELWSSLHGFLDRLSHATAQEYVTVNDDLAGFFTSIPVSRLKHACELALDRFFDNKQSGGKNRGEFWFTVDEKSASSHGNVLRGKPMKNRASACRKVFAGDLLKIIELSFSFASFTVLGRCFEQMRGSPIGNQLSPSLCNIAVCMEEDCWVRGLRQCWASDRLACWFLRYVDNRFLLFPQRCLKNEAFQRLVMPTFYRPPVMLEACDMEELLGCRVSVHDRRVTFDIPAESWQYRVPQSAGSANANLASFRARVLIVATQVYPKQDVPAQIRALSHKYLELGFHRHELLRALPAKAKRFRSFV